MDTVQTTARLKSKLLDEPIFKRMLMASVGLHLAVVLSMTVRTYIFPDEAFNLDSAIQVDMVDLPDKFQKPAPVTTETEKEVPPAPPVEKEKKETKKAEEVKKVDLKAKKKTKDDALEKIKALQALDKIKNEVDEEEEEAAQKAVPKKMKGNVLSSGTAIQGIVTKQIAGYVQLIERHAKDNWQLPKWLQDLDLKARAHVFLEKDGTVARRFIVQSSGNETYDDLVLSSIDKASPFPPPPAHFVDLVGQKGIQLGFPE
ncbi:MAG: TonB C-terminal domain-containing protein [Bdellovibrionia bacterium]